MAEFKTKADLARHFKVSVLTIYACLNYTGAYAADLPEQAPSIDDVLGDMTETELCPQPCRGEPVVEKAPSIDDVLGDMDTYLNEQEQELTTYASNKGLEIE
jgi:hypothetical protein